MFSCLCITDFFWDTSTNKMGYADSCISDKYKPPLLGLTIWMLTQKNNTVCLPPFGSQKLPPYQSMWKEPRSWFLFFIKVKTPHVVTPLFPNSWSPRPLLFSDLCDVANTKSSDRFILGGKCLQGNVQNTSICSFSSPPHLPPFS